MEIKKTTIEELNQKCEQYKQAKVEKDEAEAKLSSINKVLLEQQCVLLDILSEHGLKTYKSPFGNITAVERKTVNFPKTPEDRAKFMEFLKQQSLEDLLSINHKTLNSWYKAESEASEAMGHEGVSIPGLAPPAIFKHLSFTKG